MRRNMLTDESVNAIAALAALGFAIILIALYEYAMVR